MAGAVPFEVPVWLRHGALQTLLPALPLFTGGGAATPTTAWRRFPLHGARDLDGMASLLGLAWWHEGDAPRPLVALFHGVGGAADSTYLVRCAVALFGAGYHVVRMNMRGAGDSVATAPSLYHAGLTEDVAVVARVLGADRRVSSIALVGFSLGGNLVLKAAGEWGATVPQKVAAVCAVSPPTALDAVATHLESRRTLPYRAYVVHNLARLARRFARRHPSRAGYDVGRLSRLRTIREYDDLVIVPMHGFRDSRDYYEKASCGPGLGTITVPTCIVRAKDDPMIPHGTMTADLAAAAAAVQVFETDHGGHIGWVSGIEEEHFRRNWAHERLLAFLARHAPVPG